MRPDGHSWACPCGPCESYWDRERARQDAILAAAPKAHAEVRL